jgi:hypothetical protein
VLGEVSGINETVFPNFFFYPNPVGDELKIENGGLRIDNVEIYDMLGRLVLSQKLANAERYFSINTSALSPGVYILNICGENQKLSSRIIKK